MKHPALICAATVLLAATRALAQTTDIPLALTAAAPGRTISVSFAGNGLGSARSLWTSFRAESKPDADAKPRADRAAFLVTVPKDCPTGIGAVRLAATNHFSALVLVLIDSLPSVSANGVNRTLAKAQRVQLPVALDGACVELSSDFFVFTARAGQRLSVDVVAQRVGSALDPWVRLLDARGHELACNEDSPGAGADARLTHTIPAAGDYLVQLRDSRYQGGEAYRYRLRLGDFPLAPLPFLNDAAPFPQPAEHALKTPREVEPNDSAATATRIELPALIRGEFQKPGDRDFFQFTLPQPGRWLVLGRTRSLDSPCDLRLTLENSRGETLATSKPTSADEGIITNSFATAGTYRLRVEELNRLGSRGTAGDPTTVSGEYPYQIAIQPHAGFSLTAETEKIEAPSGGVLKLKITCARRDFDGPITLALTGDARDFALTNHIIAAKKTETTLRATLPATLAPGTVLTFQVLGAAATTDAKSSAPTALAQTLPALAKTFPNLPHPPAALDGLLTLGVLPADAKPVEENPPPQKNPGKPKGK